MFPEITLLSLSKELRTGREFLTALSGNRVGSRKDSVAALLTARAVGCWLHERIHEDTDVQTGYCMPQGPPKLYIAVYTEGTSKCLYQAILLHILQLHAIGLI